MDLSAGIATASAVIALLAAGGALFQARSARQQSKAAHAQVEIAEIQTELQKQVWIDSVQPYVYVDIRIDPVSGVRLDVVVENTGPTIATDVHIVFDPPLRSTLKKGRLTRRAISRRCCRHFHPVGGLVGCWTRP